MTVQEKGTTPAFAPTDVIAEEPKLDPHHLGPTITQSGVAFSVYAHQATAVELCLFDAPDEHGHYQSERRSRSTRIGKEELMKYEFDRREKWFA